MSRSHRSAAVLGLWASVLLLAACQVVKPQTPAEALAYTYATIEAGYQTNVQRLELSAYTKAEGRAINAALDTALNWADLANIALDAGDPQKAASYLRLATIVLDELERRAKP